MDEAFKDFKFKIGDFVQLRASTKYRPARLQVMLRALIETRNSGAGDVGYRHAYTCLHEDGTIQSLDEFAIQLWDTQGEPT